MDNKYTLNEIGCHYSAKSCCRNSAHMLPVTDWLADLPENAQETDLVEVQFKNTRKGYFHNVDKLPLEKGSVIIVEANPGYDMGEVVLTGRLVHLQIKKNRIDTSRYEIRNVVRFATEEDKQRAAEAHAKEQATMIKARQLAKSLGLEMKIGDVEYQGDGNKAIFYYIADERVDFRQLIKVLADTFHVRIEMKQIGARQEAGRIGGTGPCGRELCCATWMKNFISVSTTAARFQEISLNPQKLAGMCAKLKCCLNYEVDSYVEAGRRIPSKEVVLSTQDADFYHFKSDILAGTITYSTDKNMAVNLETITAERAKAIIEMNRRGEKPRSLTDDEKQKEAKPSVDLLQGDINRFDKAKKKKRPQRQQSKGNQQQEHNQAKAEQQERRQPRGDQQNRERQGRRPNNRQQRNHPKQNAPE